MDAKITKKRLGHLLSYDWIKMILAVVLAIVVWSLVFTTSATRITNTQRFVVCNYLNTRFAYTATAYDGYSLEIIEAEVVDQMRGGEQTFYDIFNGNMEIGEGDVMMVADTPMSRTEKKDAQGNPVLDGEGKPTYEYGESYYANMLTRMHFRLSRMDDEGASEGYFSQMKSYLGRFYEIENAQAATYEGITYATFKEDTLNVERIESEFRARIKANKDKRYKKEAQIAAAVPQEIERIQSYLAAYKQFFAYVANGDIQFVFTEQQLSDTVTLRGVYGINICPDETKLSDLKESVYYVDFDGKTTAQNMMATFLNLEKLDKNYQYENLIYLNALIADAKA